MDADSEFVFELQVCQWAERDWPPERARSILIARQLGTKRRRWDTIVVECDPDALETRARFGRERLDSDLLDVLRHAPEEWAWYRDALPDPGYPWRYVRESIHRADDREILETRTRGNRLQIRRRWAYPDWVERIVAIENKPDFDASAARALTDQLQRDVAVGLADEVWVATAGGREQFERALLEDVPVEVGILLVEGRDAEAIWQPRSLSPEQPGTRIEQRPDGGERDASAARFSYVDPDWKREKRLAIAERAYERGFRSYVGTMRPDCRHFELDDVPAGFLPHCDAKSCHQTASECRGGCPEYEPEPPTWRTGDWPIDGGPGAGIRRLLERQRLRTRPGLEE
ncbi:Uncharacterized protein HSBGL_2268 [Halapricum desulfuricans]|uniref:Uncharacterized protein n=1 Tax=Halapricum desulfuricans TaxID=2841257 RepID=A0A897NJQ9_9EURY|nr:DUF5787 family protein [Halapricum desulfuricans]QSG12674.1 Uncharacterized protein HSBGL_2268 [Halapricum desulfuricans]